MWRRNLLRRLPGLSRIARALDTLEHENCLLRQSAVQAPALVLRCHEAHGSPAQLGPDGLPFPPLHLRGWASVSDDPEWFFQGGKQGVQTLIDTLAREGKKLEQCESILDFGCGCGRVIRHLKKYDSVRVHGSDCNVAAIRWCDEHLNFAEFGSNLLEPPLRYVKHTFDFVYAFSIFTHLPERLQVAWLHEFRRVLKPRGYLLLTVAGAWYLDHMTPAERTDYQNGNLVVREEDMAGYNECLAFHPEAYVRRLVAKDFEVAAFIPEGARGNPHQDAYLLRSRG